jgi:hypothetical protein
MGLHHCSSRESRQGSLSATGLSCTVGVGHYRCAPFALAAVTPRRRQDAREFPLGAGAPGTKRTFQVAKAGKAESKRGVARQRVGLSSRRFGGGLVHARSIHPRRLFFFCTRRLSLSQKRRCSKKEKKRRNGTGQRGSSKQVCVCRLDVVVWGQRTSPGAWPSRRASQNDAEIRPFGESLARRCRKWCSCLPASPSTADRLIRPQSLPTITESCAAEAQGCSVAACRGGARRAVASFEFLKCSVTLPYRWFRRAHPMRCHRDSWMVTVRR